MAGPTVVLTAVPIGGAAMLSLPDYLVPPSGVTFMAISRAVSGSAFATIYSGATMPVYVDAGDGTPSPLSSGSAYLWNVTDDRGTTQVGPVTPVSMVRYTSDGLTNLLIRLLQCGVDSIVPPAGVNKTQVTTEMPQGGWQALPFVVVNLDLIQQSDVGIGEDVPYPNPDNDWSLWSLAKRIWRVSIFARNVKERDFWRDRLLGVYRVLKATVFAGVGLDVTHSYQAASYTSAEEWQGHTPGFYGADLMLELSGTFNTVVLTSYAAIEEIDVLAISQGVTTEVHL